MAFAQITYNGRTINFPWGHYTLQDDPLHNALVNRSASGIVETLNVNVENLINVAWRLFENANTTDATFKRNMEQFFQWAQKGNAWKLALDSSDTVLTTLANDAAAGAGSIVLTSATGVVAGRQYVIRNTTDWQVIKVNSIAGAPTITLVETLDFAFLAGDRFRSRQYWPGRFDKTRSASANSVFKVNAVTEMPPIHFDINLQFIEDMN